MIRRGRRQHHNPTARRSRCGPTKEVNDIATPLRGRLLTATAILGVVLVACGDDDEPTATPPSTTATTVTTTTEATTTEPTTTTLDGPDTFDVYLLPAETGDDCSAVIAAERQAQLDGDVRDALAQLLAGPTEEEQAEGLDSWFSDETEGMVNGVVTEAGVAEVDFADFSRIIPNASTACGSASLLAQLDNTVRQFPHVDEVVYSFDGDRAAFYEWLQLVPPE